MNAEEQEALVVELEELAHEIIRDPHSYMSHFYADRCGELLSLLPRESASAEIVERILALQDVLEKAVEQRERHEKRTLVGR
jgi:hypothetical protein